MARRGLAFATIPQPQLPARGAAWSRDSHKVLFWNGVDATRKFESNFSDARARILAGRFGLSQARILRISRLPECSSPTCSFRLLRRAKPSLALTDVHSDLGVEFLARHVVDPLTVLIHIAFDNAFGRRRAFSC